MRPFLQSLARRRAQFIHRIENPAAFARDLFVTCPGNFQFILFHPARRMDQVRMRIDEPRQRHAPAQVEILRRACLRQRLDLRPRSHGRDQAIAHQQRPIFN